MFDQIMSDRELEILALIADGYSNTQIAKKLFIEPCTVSSHIHNISCKISDFMPDGDRARVRLARWYFENYLKTSKRGDKNW